MVDPQRILDPMDRIRRSVRSHHGLTFTCTLGVATASHIEARTMLIGALGRNLAWRIIDGGVHLLGRLNKCAVQY